MLNSKSVNVSEGTLSIQEFSIDDDDLDVTALFDEMWPHMMDGPEQQLMITLDILTVCHDAFIGYWGSIDYFKTLPKKEQVTAVISVDVLLAKLANQEEYAKCNGCTLFQLWTVSIVRNEDYKREYMEKVIAEKRTKLGF